jgi:hypothetical protein
MSPSGPRFLKEYEEKKNALFFYSMDLFQKPRFRG